MKAEQKAALIKFIQREKTTCYELDTRDFCEPEIADFMRYGEVLEIALASLTAKPMIFHSGDITDLLAEGNIAAHRTGTHVMPLYPAPPVPVMKPVKVPTTKCIGWVKDSIKEHDAKWIEALREAGVQIEGEE